MEPLWRIALLGGPSLQARGGGEIRRFRSRKVALLLAYLALHLGRDCPREVLCEILWPEDDPDAARNRLRVTLASLRKQLEPPGVPFGAVLDASVTGNVRLSAETVTTDVREFDAALKRRDTAAARALYAAPLLPSFYDDWILDERERLEALAGWLAPDESPPNLGAGGQNQAEGQREAGGQGGADALPRVGLPVYLTRFFGRDDERARLAGWLADPAIRLVTLTGPGGNGKTRLAVEAARSATRPAWFVALADLWDGSRLAEVVRDALALPRGAGDPLQQAANFLVARDRPLLVLDNLEQIATRAAPTVAALLERVPGLAILAASRRRLELPGERECVLAPLDAPAEESALDLAAVAASPAVALFLDRAQSVRPDFGLTQRNAADVAALCRLLDGIPLGLELAAARAASLAPAQIRARLTEKWDSLGAEGKRFQKEDRHRSLRAAIDWSFALLPPDQQRLFLSLSVFRGGAALEAVEEICGQPGALDALTRLRASSLVLSEERGGAIRFALLETLRQWAEERLDSGETALLASRHGAFFLQRAERAEEPLHSAEEGATLDALEADLPNFRAALERAGPPDAARLSGALAPLWDRRGYLQEGREWLERTLVSAPDDGTRLKILLGLGTVLARQGDGGAAVRWLDEGLALARRRGPLSLEGPLLGALGFAALSQGDPATAGRHFEASRALRQVSGDRFGEAAMLGNLGAALRDRGELADARLRFEEAIQLSREIGHARCLAHALNNLGALCVVLGDSDGAVPYLEESLALKRASGDRHGATSTLGNLAVLACRRADWPTARRMTEENLGALRMIGDGRGLGINLNRLGQIVHAQGDLLAARRHLNEALTLRLRLGNPHDILMTLSALAQLSLEEGDPARAARLLGAAATHRTVPLPPDEAREVEETIAQVRAALSPSVYAARHAEGEKLTDADLAPK